MFEIFSGILALAALFSFINARLLRLPETIGVMILSIVTSLILGAIYFIHQPTFINVCHIVEQIEFRTILFDFLLGILLFAGAVHVDLNHLLKERSSVVIYATLGVLVSTFIVGTLFYYLAGSLGLSIYYPYCLVFGALISPTDPVAVLAILKKAGAPKHLEIRIVGESLFNDGVGIVVLLTILSLATMMESFEATHVLKEFLLECGGGILMGLMLGFMGKMLIYRVAHQPVLAVHISLAIVLGGYSLSSALHLSGALAMVVSGISLGNGLKDDRISHKVKDYMTIFWKVLDEIFNAVLFLMIGLEILTLKVEVDYLFLATMSIVIVLVARYAVVLLSNLLLRRSAKANRTDRLILTWAGLRGGISIALALTLPESMVRDLILFCTYTVVVFSIIVQGLTIGKLISTSAIKSQ